MAEREKELERKEEMGHLHSAIRQMEEGLVYNMKKWNEFMKEKQQMMNEDLRVVEENEERMRQWDETVTWRKRTKLNS